MGPTRETGHVAKLLDVILEVNAEEMLRHLSIRRRRKKSEW